MSTFEGLQRCFLKQYGNLFRRSLQECFAGNVDVRPVQPAQDVQERFLKHCKGTLQEVRPVFHGTRSANHASIFDSGFLIPGQNNSIPIRNGCAHGLGVYTAKVENAWLSRTFCDAPKMIVCAVVDDAKPLNQPAPCGNFHISAESKHVRHVGDAVVVFDESRVVPLFEASGATLRAQRAQKSLPNGTPPMSAVKIAERLYLFEEAARPTNAYRREKRRARKHEAYEALRLFFRSRVEAHFMRRAAVKRRQ